MAVCMYVCMHACMQICCFSRLFYVRYYCYYDYFGITILILLFAVLAMGSRSLDSDLDLGS